MRAASSYARGRQHLLQAVSARASHSQSPMWAHQAKLPRFPLPALPQTLERFQGALQALLTPEEFEAYKHTMDAYASGEGLKVQAELERLNVEAPSWIAGYWQTMYETLRCPLPVYVNPYLLVGADPVAARDRDPILKAAAHLEAIGRFSVLIRTGQLKPDMLDAKTPMDMIQFSKILGSTRIPAATRDYMRTTADTKHAVVAVLGQFFSIPVLELNGSTWSVRPQADLARELAALRAYAHAHSSRPNNLYPVGALTAEERDRWATVRSELMRTSERNRHSLDEIERGLLLVCLDETVPAHPLARHAGALFGNNGNRFFDKSLQLIINRDGSAAYNMEHTPIDGQTLFRFMVDTWQDVANQTAAPAPVTGDLSKVPVRPLAFDLTPSLRHAIEGAHRRYNTLVSYTDLAVLDFADFGKERIKTLGLSPDAFAQLGAQIAQLRTSKKLVSTYESSSVRHYNLGRTETIRSLTKEMRAAVEAFENPAASSATKRDAIKAAGARHVAVAKASKVGEGWDRHLQGMKYTAEQMVARGVLPAMPALFTAPQYEAYMANQLSTSNVGGGFAGVESFGFGAVHADGIGWGYMINNDSLPATATSYTGRATTWIDNLAQAYRDLDHFLGKHK